MEPYEQRTRRAPRVLIGGIVLFGLLTLVSLASRSGFGRSTDASPSTDYLSWAYSAFLVLWVLAIPVTIWALYMQGSNMAVERPGFKRVVIQNVASVAIICALIGGALYLKQHGHWRQPNSDAVNKVSNDLKNKKNKKPAAAEPTFKWPVVVVIGGLILIAAVPLSRAYLHERRRRRAQALREPTQRELIAADFEILIDDLAAEPDVRAAIIAAYARMEAVFAQHGLERRRSETSGEYLHRIVGSLTERTEPVERLTALFERAKFSREDLDAAAKEDAIVALGQIRDDMAEVR